MVLMATYFINFFSLAFLAAWSMMLSVAVHARLSDEMLTVNLGAAATKPRQAISYHVLIIFL